MLFTSAVFLLFAPLMYVGWTLARSSPRLRLLLLTAGSFVFYAWGDPRHLPVLVASGLVDFVAGRWMARRRDQASLALAASVLTNLGLLAAFRYQALLQETAALLTGHSLPAAVDPAALPVGISFYTFQSMSYTIDVYRRRLEPTEDVVHFFAYLALFPQLVAGPIVRASHLLPQLRTPPRVTWADRWAGLTWIAEGYAMKTVVADHLAPWVERGFDLATVPAHTGWAWAVVAGFGLQIYADFHGYSAIAIGLGRWFGLDFPRNFHHPYLATSARDFWGRWHISLSTWFRDYVYIPLGGSRRGTPRTLANLWTVMLVSGLWHGPSWRFAAWGALHAAYVSVEHLTRWPDRLARVPGGRLLSGALTAACVTYAWTYFRAPTFEHAWAMSGAMLWPSWQPVPVHLWPQPVELAAAGGLVAWELTVALRLRHRLHATAPQLGHALDAVTVGLALAAAVLLRGPGSVFLYFQF